MGWGVSAGAKVAWGDRPHPAATRPLTRQVSLPLPSRGQGHSPVAFSPHSKPDNPLAKLLAEIDQGTRGEALVAKLRELKVKSLNLFDLSTVPQEDEASKKDEKGK